MAKCDVTKWTQTWHQELSRESKLLYAYIWDNADAAGCWHIDIEEANKSIGEFFTMEHVANIVEADSGKILNVDGKEFLWLTRFCKQYPTLSDRYFGHRNIIRLVRYYDLFDEPLVKSLFRSGNQYVIDKRRKKLNLDVLDKEDSGERDLFNAMSEEGIPLSWQDWRRLCQLFPKIDKFQVLQSISEIIPQYLPKHIIGPGKTQKRRTHPEHLWLMVVDIAERSMKPKCSTYTGAMAESLMSGWFQERVGKCHKNKKTKKLKP